MLINQVASCIALAPATRGTKLPDYLQAFFIDTALQSLHFHVTTSCSLVSAGVLSALETRKLLRLAGAVVAASNAALALVQLGDEPAAILEMRKALRRAPGSADLRAALAALYWSQVSPPDP